MLRLVLIGLLAGLFSALFGVGGGIVVVPLLLLVAHYAERPAMAGAVAGTTLQQRLANRTLSLAFAALLTALGVRLLV